MSEPLKKALSNLELNMAWMLTVEAVKESLETDEK